MTVSFVDSQHIDEEEIESLDSIVDDGTIGILGSHGGLRGQIRLDINRLRRALIAYDDEIGETTVELGIVERDDLPPLLALTANGGGNRSIVLAPCVSPDSGEAMTGADGLVEHEGGE